MKGPELKDRRNRLKIIRRHFANLLGITESKLYRLETSRETIDPYLDQKVAQIEEKLSKSKHYCRTVKGVNSQ